jgi:hypothetical protein
MRLPLKIVSDATVIVTGERIDSVEVEAQEKGKYKGARIGAIYLYVYLYLFIYVFKIAFRAE